MRKDIFTINFEAFTVLPCAHVFHRECVERSFLLIRQNNCPVTDCTAIVKPIVSDRVSSSQSSVSTLSTLSQTSATTLSQSSTSSLNRRMSSQLQIEEQEMGMDIPEAVVQPVSYSKKRTNESTNLVASWVAKATCSNKKAKQSKVSKDPVRLEDSNILKKLIRELSSDTPISEVREREGLHRESSCLAQKGRSEDDGARTFFDLYYKITKAEELNETAHHGLVSSYYYFGEELEKRLAHFRQTNEEHEALKKLYDEVKDQLPKEITRFALRKKANRARRVYDLFFRIGDDKSQRALYIRRIKTFTATSIGKLREDEVKYVATKVREGHQAQ